MQADVILKEPPPWVPPLSLSGGARVEGGGGRTPPSYAPEVRLYIVFTRIPLLFRPTAISDLRQLFIFVLFQGCQVETISGLSDAARTGQGTERRGQDRPRGQVHIACCKTTCQQVGCVLQLIWRRSEVEYSGFAQI